MSKMQKGIKFASYDDFFYYLPSSEQIIVERLRELIRDNIPHCREKLSYNVPYYYLNSRVCYIWPSSIPWGNVPLNGVQLGFCYGNLLDNSIDFLELGNRKQVAIHTYYHQNEIDESVLKSVLFEAVKLDDQMLKMKRQ